MPNRYRRLRACANIRSLIAETRLSGSQLLQPFFVMEGRGKKAAIASMPGIHRYTSDLVLTEIEHFIRLGGKGAVIFGVASAKDTSGKWAYSEKSAAVGAIKAIKRNFPEFTVISDVCLCAYLSHGHCGLLKDGQVDNDATLPVLAKMAAAHARAGADMVAPSDMMDFRVAAIRRLLDQEGFANTGILSYAVKYASAYYGPFREAAGCAPGFGDRKSYQMDPANRREALKEAQQDVAEGADIVMVKPALAYLDVVALLHERLSVPVAAYNVSGEYSLIKAAAANGWVDEKSIVLETLLSMKRAGADLIISYHAKDALTWLK